MLETRFTALIGCSVPLQLAGMPQTATPELVSAVAGAGGLGMLGAPRIPPAVLAGTLDDLAVHGVGAFGVNFLMPFLDRDAVEVAASRARVVEFFYAEPDPALVELVQAGGALCSWQVGSLEEAQAAEQAGCDLVVAQGVEAGGHIRGRIGLLALLEQVLPAIGVPVVAAGGIGSPRAMAAALAAGADAVRVGTRFVAAAESGAHPRYVAALLAAEAADTVVTEAFSVRWPNAPHRVLRASLEAAKAFPGEIVGETEIAGARIPLPRFGTPNPTRATTGAVEAMPHYAGESVGGVRAVQPAAEIVREMAGGAERLLRRWAEPGS